MNQREFESQFRDYVYMLGGPEACKDKVYLKPILNEDKSGFKIDGHYHYQNAWAFEKIYKSRQTKHIDYGSQVSWLEILAAVTQVESYDLSLPPIEHTKVKYRVGDVTSTGMPSNSIESLSSLHVIEHIGLGRYGDPLDPEGTKKACKELSRILAPGGNLYLSLPVGQEKTIFNAHRVLNPESILEWCKDLKLIELSASHVFKGPSNHNETNYKQNVSLQELKEATYSCGMYHFGK